MTHPFRKLAVHSYSPNVDGDPFVAFIGPVGRLTVHFTGETCAEAEAKADAFRLDAIFKNEAELIARANAAAKRKAK